jgi:hypothetical protein
MNERGELNERLARSAAARAHTPGYARTLRPCGAAQARLCGDTPCGAAQAGLKGQGLKGQGRRRRKNDGRQEEERTRFGKRLTARGSSTPGMSSSRIWKLYSLIGMALPCPTKQPKESLGFLLHPNTILIYATRWWPVPTARVRTLSCRL